ncbi:P-loop containing nucleoside triphosphate hydrolase protein [Daldinia caldariorum]|uniref:P-loop containing nucleoside triphosphate hydrolase protein n=1 Tax=Daldinia caldariorum TaxID=326644 RepID=UPI002008B10A|nr:P-loop containing nucleoside triphosphate hydrolase protein [Daldinia caldariorum]KAI1462914.1 P-loop containing nucleoside triphosphate hydrolase protein [Daldinia caldariorum]
MLTNMLEIITTVVRRFLSRINLSGILSLPFLGGGGRTRGTGNLNQRQLETVGTTGYTTGYRYPGEIGDAPTKLYKPHHPKEPIVFFILGAPGTGKGTISTFLDLRFPNLTHLSYGDLIRYQDGIPGSWVNSLPRQKGTKKPDIPARLAVLLMRIAIEIGKIHNGQLAWLIDGFPRNEHHVVEWVTQMPQACCIFYLSCPPEVSFARVLGRALTSGRPDDGDESAVWERITRSIAESKAMLVALEESGMKITRVDANREPEVVREEILEEIKKVLV